MNLIPFRSLETIGHLTVMPAALEHPNVKETRALAQIMNDRRNRERVIGTDNSKSRPGVQLYGWGRNVEPHVDNTGIVYFTPLLLTRTIAYTDRARIRLRVGGIYRLNDFQKHWTRDSGPAVCLFAGIFNQVKDAQATAMLIRGVERLAAGDETAPRVSENFRIRRPDECFAETPAGKKLVKITEAKKNLWLIAECAHCDGLADITDKHFPIYQERNRCRECLIK